MPKSSFLSRLLLQCNRISLGFCYHLTIRKLDNLFIYFDFRFFFSKTFKATEKFYVSGKIKVWKSEVSVIFSEWCYHISRVLHFRFNARKKFENLLNRFYCVHCFAYLSTVIVKKNRKKNYFIQTLYQTLNFPMPNVDIIFGLCGVFCLWMPNWKLFGQVA